MNLLTKLKSKVAIAYSSNFRSSYIRFTLKHVKKRNGVPKAALTKPITESKVALISTAGIHLKSDRPFDVDNPHGDHTLRMIPGNVNTDSLDVTHIYYDTKHAKADPSIVFPLEQLREFAHNQRIGSVSAVHLGLNGGILDTTLVEEESIPLAVKILKDERVDIALMMPG